MNKIIIYLFIKNKVNFNIKSPSTTDVTSAYPQWQC